MGHRVGIDIGGTFTDVVLLRDDGRFHVYKEDSTPDQPLLAITRGLSGMAEEAGTTVAQLLRETEFLVHGQTMATNALIQRNGPVIGLLCTQGLRDIMYLGRGGKPERFNIHLQKPEDFIPRYLRLGIPERTGADGSEVLPLDEEAVRVAARQLGAHGVKAVAVAYLWSIVDPSHEKRTAEIVHEELPGVDVLCSCDVLPEIREWERTSATVLSAYIAPIIGDYLRAFEKEMAAGGLPHPPQIMQVNGGCASVPDLLARPVNAVASGPAAGPAAGAHYASDTKAPDRLIIIDMGGTSFDVCMLRDSEPVMSTDIKVAHQPIGGKRGSKCCRSAPAAAPLPGSTAARHCGLGRRARVLSRARPVMVGVAVRRPSPTPTWPLAGCRPERFWADGVLSTSTWRNGPLPNILPPRWDCPSVRPQPVF